MLGITDPFVQSVERSHPALDVEPSRHAYHAYKRAVCVERGGDVNAAGASKVH